MLCLNSRVVPWPTWGFGLSLSAVADEKQPKTESGTKSDGLVCLAKVDVESGSRGPLFACCGAPTSRTWNQALLRARPWTTYDPTMFASPTRVVLLAVVALASILRLYGLTRESLWNDELSTMSRLLPGVLSEEYWAKILKDCHPPGYLLLMSGWTAIFGNGEVALRLPSALAGLLTPLATFFLGRKVYGSRGGLAAAILCAVSPMLILYSQEARSYAIVTLLTVVFAHQLLTLLLAEVSPDEPPKIALRRAVVPIVTSAVGAALCAYVHYSGLLTVAALGAFAWLYVLGFKRQLALPLGVACMGFVLCYLPWLGGLRVHLAQGGLTWLRSPSLDDLKNVFGIALPYYVFPLVIAVIAVGGWRVVETRGARTAHSNWRVGTLFFLWWTFTLPLGFYLKSIYGTPIFSERNLLVIVPPVLALVAGAITAGTPKSWTLPAAAMLSFLVLSDLSLGQRFYTVPNKQDFRGAAAASLEFSARANAPAIICYAWSKEYFAYYLARELDNIELRCASSPEKVLKRLQKGAKSGSPVVLAYAHKVPDNAMRRRLAREFTVRDEVHLHKAGALLLVPKRTK